MKSLKIVFGLMLIAAVIVSLAFLSAMLIKATSLALLIVLAPATLFASLMTGFFVADNIVK